MNSQRVKSFFITVLFSCIAFSAPAENLGALKPVPFESLSSTNISNFAKQALTIQPERWKHSETDNFIYHYFDSFVATPVSVEAEYYYRVIAKELEKDTTRWERKSHIFLFQTPADWKAFQGAAKLDPWTGGLHRLNELFLLRDAEMKWKGNTLGHEIAHLVVDRFYGANVPLWLNEGYAEYVSVRAYSAYMRARNYRSSPRSISVPPASYIPVAKLTTALDYPEDPLQVTVFYNESERLVRFLSATDKAAFLRFMSMLSAGSKFETALMSNFPTQFPNNYALDNAFKSYASRNADDNE